MKGVSIEQFKKELDDGYEVSKTRRDNWLRHSRGWVASIVDFVLLGLPLVAPIPNLINLAIALQPVMGFWASTIAAVAFELLLFGSAEIILYLQDKQMRDGGYEKALRIAIGCGVAFVFILLSLITAYEVPLHGWAVLTLPFVSVISIAFLSLKRWADIRDSISKDRAQYEDTVTVLSNKLSATQHELGEWTRRHSDTECQRDSVICQLSESRELMSVLQDKINDNERQMSDILRDKEVEMSELLSQIEIDKSRTKSLETQLEDARSEVDKLREKLSSPERKPKNGQKMSKKQRQSELIVIFDKIADPGDIDHDKLADKFGTSARTISRDIDELVTTNRLSLNGKVEVIQ